jgi:hypothetical protein
MKNFLSGKKTYIVAGLMALVAVVNLMAGDITMDTLLADPNVKLLLEAAIMAALRHGVATSK